MRPPQRLPCSWRWTAFGRLDVLVNNAGYGKFAPFEQMSAEDFQAIVDTCFLRRGVHNTRPLCRLMRKQKGGHIFQVSSVGWPPRGSGQYAVSTRPSGPWAVSVTRLAMESRAVRCQGLHARAGRYSGPTGHGRGWSECAGLAAGVV